MKLIRIVLADDQILIRTGVRTVLGVFQDLKIVGEAGTTPEALRLVQEFQPEILLMDIAMEAGEGHNLIRRVTQEFPETRSMVITSRTERESITRALIDGTNGYLLKSEDPESLPRAVRAVAAGGTYICPSVSACLVGEYKRLSADIEEPHSPRLTPRQKQILIMIARGISTKGIAKELAISVKTVVKYAIRNNLVGAED